MDTSDQIEERKSKRQRLRRYDCKICGLVRSRRVLLKPHIFSQHFEKIGANGEVDELIGRKRKREVMDEAKLKIDREREIKGSKQKDLRRYCCKICGFVRGSRERLREHINSHEVEKISDEDGIEGRIGEVNGSTTIDVRRYCCQLCGLVRSKRGYLRLHIIAEHSKEIAGEQEIDGLITKKTKEDEVDGLQPMDTPNETEERKSKGRANFESGKSKRQRLRRYHCIICGLVRSRRELLKPHIFSQHFEKIGANGEVDGLIGRKRKKEVMAEAKLKIDTEGEIKVSKQKDLRRYCCKICGFVRGSRERLRQHISSHDFEKISDEDGIEGMIGEFNGSTTMDVRRYCCQLCGLVRSKRSYLRLHIITEHNEEIAGEQEIDGLITKKTREDEVDGLQPRKEAEEANDEFKGMDRTYDCKLCGVIRSKRELLKLHIIRDHGLEALEEDKRFTKEEGEDEKLCPRVCDECGASFQKPSHLQQHKMTHFAQEVLRCLNQFSIRWETTLEELVY